MNKPEVLHGIRLVVMDLDGTILDHEKRIHPSVLRTVHHLQRIGVASTIATGRGYASAAEYARALGVKIPLIALDGTLVRGEDRIVFEMPLSRTAIQAIQETVTSVDAPMFVVFYTADEALVPLSTREDIDLSRWGARPEPATWTELLHGRPLRCFVVADREVLEEIREKILAQTSDVVAWIYPSEVYGYYYLDIRPAQANKALGVRVLREALGIRKEEVMVVGDFYNDVEMFQEAGFRVAVANAVPELKALADYITQRDHTEGGAAEALQLILGRHHDDPVSR